MAATRRRGVRSIRGALAAACAAAGVGGVGGIGVDAVGATEVHSALLLYSEPRRVSAAEAVLEARHELKPGYFGDFKIVWDALSGPSPNGAVPSRAAQTFTRPSGRGAYTTTAGETPLDDTFRDQRVAVSGGLTVPVDRLTKATAGLYGSTEHDYTSLGANVSLARDFDRRNTTVSLGASFSDDTVRPEGGRPAPLTPMTLPGEARDNLAGDGSKRVTDLVAGVTQVVDRATLLQINASLSRVSGYQSDPYKVVSVVSPETGAPQAQLFESRPDAREKRILYGRLKRDFTPGIVDLSYRYMSDDWGIVSHTFDLRYRRDLAGERWLEPHLRFYRQGEADFYRRWLVQGDPLPEFASADHRLGAFDAWTAGLEYGCPVGEGQRLNARVEYYWQVGDRHPAGAPGELAGLDLFPALDAWIVQVGYVLGL